MTQPRLLADFAAVPTPRERRHARAENRSAQLDMFADPIDDEHQADALCPVCAGPHDEQQCPHGTAPTLALATTTARTCYPCREHRHATCPNHRVGTQGIIGRPCDCPQCEPPTLPATTEHKGSRAVPARTLYRCDDLECPVRGTSVDRRDGGHYHDPPGPIIDHR